MKRVLTIALLACGSLSGGCQTKPEKHYPMSGEVLSVEASREMITVKHGEIAGLMPAMTMEYQVADVKQIEGLKAGDTISADLVVGESVGRLEKIVVLAKAVPPLPPAAAKQK